ncbi:MAG: hypothetical protein JXQ30_17095 [Spirochaetes bacterium]|nr:hypothetical protein [Spirochaetota bacterium]
MGIRGYVIAGLKAPLDEEKLWNLTKKLESLDEVAFAARVIGPYDFVITLDAEGPFDACVKRITETAPFERIVTLKTDDTFVKHREIRDLEILKSLS